MNAGKVHRWKASVESLRHLSITREPNRTSPHKHEIVAPEIATPENGTCGRNPTSFQSIASPVGKEALITRSISSRLARGCTNPGDGRWIRLGLVSDLESRVASSMVLKSGSLAVRTVRLEPSQQGDFSPASIVRATLVLLRIGCGETG